MPKMSCKCQLRRWAPPLSFLWNIALVYLLYMLCRGIYVWEFWNMYAADWHQLSLRRLLQGGLQFDTTAILYTNLLYLLLQLAPLPPKWTDSRAYRLATKTVFVTVNALMLFVNLADTVYSRYTGRRTTWTFFSEFRNESNLGSIVGIEVVHHWYLVLVGLAFLAALLFLYRPTAPARNATRHYVPRVAGLLLFIPLGIIGIRGGVSTAVRPVTLSNANQYVNRPSQAAIVLNTPFSLIRTLGKPTFTNPGWYTPEELDALYSPLHQAMPGDGIQALPGDNKLSCNVVVIIVESMGAEYMGFYNRRPAEGAADGYPSYTPFLDSLAAQSLTFSQSFANGHKSIDAMPSILSGIPMFVEPFFLTPYSLNTVSGLAGELGKVGYRTAFFHGAANGSMGFEAYARATGFQRYFGRTEYNADPRFGGDADFDGTWAVWDEPFLQYCALTLAEMKEPFMTTLFTASSHHPYRVPDHTMSGDIIDGSAQAAGHPMYRCIRYTDYALRRFFETASQMPWYENTLFVITADHTNHSEQPYYQNILGPYRIPILFYDPSGRLPRGQWDAVAQQTDIMPTVLGALGYPNPYIAYGVDLLNTPADSTWALHYCSSVYQYVRQGHLLIFDGEKATGLYHIDTDPLQQHNLLLEGRLGHPLGDEYTCHVKAIIQSYMTRMTTNTLVPSPER